MSSHKPGPMERALTEEMAALPVDDRPFHEIEAEQLDLLRGDDDRLPDNVFRMRRKPGAGRTPGAPNRKHNDFAKLFVHKYGDPVEFLGQVYSQPMDQMIDLALIAEGVPQREAAIIALCDRVDQMLLTATTEGWSGEKMKQVARMVESLERSANALKAKPGDIAMKVLGHKIQAAKEAAAYVRSKKPHEVQHKADVAFRAIFVGGHGVISPEQQEVLKQAHDAVNAGLIEERQLASIRVIDGEFSVSDDDVSDGYTGT